MSEQSAPLCLSCQKASIEQKYCEHCGQKKYESRFTWSYIVAEVLQSFNFERGILFNINALRTNAGETLQEYLAGKTRPFYPPWQFFSVGCGVFFFLLLSQITSLIGVNNDKQAEEAANYYQAVYDKNYAEIASYLQDSLITIQAVDSLQLKIQKKGKELSDIRYLENNEKQRADEQAKFLQVFTYLGFYFFPLYLAVCSIFLFKNNAYYFSEHLIIHLFVMGQIIFYICIVFCVGFGLQYLLRSIEKTIGVDTDALVALLQASFFVGILGYSWWYISLAFCQVFNEKIVIGFIKTVTALAVSFGVAFLLSFICGEMIF